MPLLHIALQEGFAGDAVVLRINGREVFNQPAVKTRMQTGFAAACEENVPAGACRAEICLPGRPLTESIDLSVACDTWLGVSLMPEGRLSRRISTEPFGYV
ncbi:MAG: hypothetical protein HY301_11295 [Verrucomicrobia bacterium]|nr:hypothetical protein [Verrucomicrobiota bacterium]